jgi:DNA polymerase-3 subunit alpha
MTFVPLRVFSSFTMLEGAIEPKAIAKTAKQRGFPAVALADRNGLYAAMAFSEACSGAGVQPIIGATVGIARPAECGASVGTIDWLVLLAKDETGYLNLCQLVSAAHMDRPDHLGPHIDLLALSAASDGLIALTAGGEGGVARLLADGQASAARLLLERLAAIFADRLYVELSRRGDPVEEAAEAPLIDLADALGLPLVATNPASYADSDFHAAHDALLCIAGSAYVESNDRVRSSAEAWMKPSGDMEALFADLPDAIANTAVVAQRCAVAAPKRRCPRRPRSAARRPFCGRPATLPRAARLRDRRHRAHGLFGLLSDRRRLHPMGQGKRHSRGTRAWIGSRVGCRLVIDHHGP